MADLKIDTAAVVSAANNIKNLNKQMQDGMAILQTAINALDRSWDGAAATNAISKYNEMKSEFSENRYNVLENYANFLLHQVGEGYTETESVNVSLADAFK